MKFVKPEIFSLKESPEYNEKWVQDIIANDPSILNLGKLILKDKERIQPHAGRLDLLLQDEEATTRYEVEIQLGKTDEAHIIRTIEYWDIEKKKYRQYEHCAVIIAEDITSRFLNVISLFNGAIPLIAIQMKAVKLGENVSLLFTTVLNQFEVGIIEEEDEGIEITDRTYWEQIKGTKNTVSMADRILLLIKTFAPKIELKYNKFYIGLAQDGQSNLFVLFRPQKSQMRLELRLDKSDELEEEIEKTGLKMLDYDNRWKRYKIALDDGDIEKHRDFILKILKVAYDR